MTVRGLGEHVTGQVLDARLSVGCCKPGSHLRSQGYSTGEYRKMWGELHWPHSRNSKFVDGVNFKDVVARLDAL